MTCTIASHGIYAHLLPEIINHARLTVEPKVSFVCIGDGSQPCTLDSDDRCKYKHSFNVYIMYH